MAELNNENELNEDNELNKDTNTKLNTDKENLENTDQKKANFLKNLNLKNKNVFIIIGIILAIIIVSVIVFFQTPGYKAGRQLDLGIKYLEEMNYEEAILCFNKAIEIDPNNEKLRAEIESYLEDFYVAARKLGEEKQYSDEREIAVFMLDVNKESVYGKIADAESSLGLGEVTDAKEKYDEAKGNGVDEEFITEELAYCDAILQIVDLASKKQWDQIATLINNKETIDALKNNIEAEIVYGDQNKVAIGTNEQGIYVYSGDFADSVKEGNGVVVVSATNTTSIYEGAWKAGNPNGSGSLKIWNKNMNSAEANILKGNFINGILDGAVEITVNVNGEMKTVPLNVAKGVVSVFKTDEKGRVWLSEDLIENGCVYIVEYFKENNGVIADYIAGVPMFGGSDQMLVISYADIEAPVLSYTLARTAISEYNGQEYPKWHNGKPGIHGIKAVDNVDGNISDKIEIASKTKGKKHYTNDYYTIIETIVYSATDTAGNTGTLTIKYELECGGYTVESINK